MSALLHEKTRGLWLAAAFGLLALPAFAQTYSEPPLFAERVAKKELPPVAERVPKTPLVVDPTATGGQIGQYGGEIVTLIPRARDIRYISTYAYTRLIGYDRDLKLQPDLLEKVDNEDDRVFTFTLRASHR